jgi:hypothetical protein
VGITTNIKGDYENAYIIAYQFTLARGCQKYYSKTREYKQTQEKFNLKFPLAWQQKARP